VANSRRRAAACNNRSKTGQRQGALAVFTAREQGGPTEAELKQAFRAFVGHLENKGFVVRNRLMRREPHEGFERGRPRQSYYVAIEFPNLALEQACYEYVAADREPIRTLHHAVNSKVEPDSTSFFLCSDV
jgi:hypothetical protein